MSDPREASEDTFFDAVGGADTFRRLVATFYAGVAEDPVLRPLYPEEDLGPAEDRLRMFLEQYWGGPRPTPTSGDTLGCGCGTPHSSSDRPQRDAWLAHMRVAVDEIALPPEQEALLWDYLVMAAQQHGQLLRMTGTSRTLSQVSTGPWWRDAVIYQVYVRSFADSDGDGSATCPASALAWPTSASSASTRSG